MNIDDELWSRRPFLLGGVGLALQAQQPAATEPLTAGKVLERIKANVGVPWRAQTVDNLIAGTPDLPVKGIATTMMATFDVIKRAHQAGKNMVITHEPTFYSHQDTLDQLREDKTYQAKREFIDQNGIVVFHFHDHWHARRPDGIAAGMARELGWEKNVDAQNQRLFHFDRIPLARLALEIESKLQARTMRVLGDPQQRLNNVLASWGYTSQFPGIPNIARPEIDALVIGETREWELVEYVQDMIAAGLKKSLIVIGHVLSEQAGMKFCAEWLRPIVPEVPVEFVGAAEPFWLPGKPIA